MSAPSVGDVIAVAIEVWEIAAEQADDHWPTLFEEPTHRLIIVGALTIAAAIVLTDGWQAQRDKAIVDSIGALQR